MWWVQERDHLDLRNRNQETFTSLNKRMGRSLQTAHRKVRDPSPLQLDPSRKDRNQCGVTTVVDGDMDGETAQPWETWIGGV